MYGGENCLELLDNCLVVANATCSERCGGRSCWGPGDDQCIGCPHYRRNDTGVCLQSCDDEPLLYADDSAPQKQCRPCDPLCLNSCDGPVVTAYSVSIAQHKRVKTRMLLTDCKFHILSGYFLVIALYHSQILLQSEFSSITEILSITNVKKDKKTIICFRQLNA